MALFDKSTTNDDLNYKIGLLQDLKSKTRHLRELYSQANQYPVASHLKQICISSDKILKEISVHQDKIAKATVFIDYYIPTTITLLEQYIVIKDNKLTGQENQKIVTTIEAVLPKIKSAFNEFLNHLFSEDNSTIDAEIKVLMNELKNSSN